MTSGLLNEQQLEEARAGGRWSEGDEENHGPLTDEQLADRLVELGRLNRWQAVQLLEGRTKFSLGPYWIVDSIGQGGMGQVFKAEHSVMGRVVAIKVLPLSKSSPDAVANFAREIRALASLDHPKLVRALDAGHDGNVYYLVTEYVPGGDLRKLVRHDGRLSMTTAANIVYQVVEGLRYAHSQGLIHRDVKPGNVLVTPQGEAKLSDLGLAGPSGGDVENDPRFGKIVGTADYVSPDHIESPWEPTPAWDIYSLGCTLYYAVTGKVPFPGGTTSDKARAHCDLRPLDPRRLNSELTDAYVDLMADMMAKDPAQRIRSAAAVMKRLSPWVDRVILSATPAPSAGATAPVATTPLVTTPPPVPPRIAMPPASAPRVAKPRTAKPQMAVPPKRPGEPGIADTQTDFLGTPQPTPGEKQSDSLEVEIRPTEPNSPSAGEIGPWSPLLTSITGPLTVLVLLPLLLIAVVMAIWLLVQRIW